MASKYSKQAAVKAVPKNCTIDKVKLIMEAGQFTNMNEVVSKFINTCTEATGQQNTVLHYQKQNIQNFRGRYNNYRRGNNYRNKDKVTITTITTDIITDSIITGIITEIIPIMSESRIVIIQKTRRIP